MSRELKKQAFEVLNDLQQASHGLLLPEAVVEQAKDETSPLHGYFEWSDTDAAAAYRLAQARSLIRVFTVEVKIQGSQKPEKVRAFVSLRPDRKAGNGYRAMADVLDDELQYKQLLTDALADAQTFKRKYSMLKEVEAVLAEIDRLVDSVPTVEQDEQRASA